MWVLLSHGIFKTPYGEDTRFELRLPLSQTGALILSLHVLRGQGNEIFGLQFIGQTIPHGPLINRLKPFRV
jgi:hypothetical protein